MQCQHTAKATTFVHQIESLVDVVEDQVVGYVLIDLDLLLHVLLHEPGHLRSARLLKPPKAVPFHTQPVTSWKGRVDIS